MNWRVVWFIDYADWSTISPCIQAIQTCVKFIKELQPYKHRENELSTENGCVMWGMRVVVPQTLHSQVLKSLHSNHPGITWMKAIARSYVLLLDRT